MLPTAFHTARCKPPRSWLRREAWTPSAPNFGRKGITIEALNSFCRCCFLVSSSVVLISSFHCIVLFSLSATILIVLTYDSYCYNAMMYCSFVHFAHCMLSEISNLHVELISKLRRDSSWENVKLAFTCDLWHSRCMKAYFTMTAHWIEIREGALTQVVCLPIGYLTPYQCRRHPLTTKVSGKMF